MIHDGEALLEQGRAMIEAKRYNDAIRYLKEAIVKLPSDSPMSNSAHLYLAKALLDNADSKSSATSEQVINLVAPLLVTCDKNENPTDFGWAHNLIGCAYRDLLEATSDTEYLKRAISHFKEALTVFTVEEEPHMFCSAAYNLASMYGYAEVAGVDIGELAVFQARYLLEKMLPVANRLNHPNILLYSMLYQDILDIF